jgi:DNA helicase HerA-like ATPase
MHALGTYRRYNKRRRKFTSPAFCISEEDRLRHLYVVGKTGAGKSTLLLNSIAQDIRNGRGCILVDPKGAIVKLTLEIAAEAPDGFPDGEVSVVRDNAKQLKFKAESTGFEE